MDDDGKVYSNIKVLLSKLSKAKEQMELVEEKKESVLGAIKKYKVEEKGKNLRKKKHQKKLKDKMRWCGLITAPIFFCMKVRENVIIYCEK
ncbi:MULTISPECIES: hypothetical protein [unclassified Breznakia]|nr:MULTISPECIES: hypothetical protein [unclassified Breznakia]